jgi:hypothetical protein
MSKTTAVVLMASLLFVGASAATTRVRQPSMDDIGIVWVGGDSLAATQMYLRLALEPDGKGLLTVQYLPGEQAVAYRVSRTILQKYEVTIEAQPIDPLAEPIYLRGEATPAHLQLRIGSASRKWERDVSLQPYSDLMNRLRVVTERAERELGK